MLSHTLGVHADEFIIFNLENMKANPLAYADNANILNTKCLYNSLEW